MKFYVLLMIYLPCVIIVPSESIFSEEDYNYYELSANKIEYDGSTNNVLNLTQLEMTSLCQRFENFKDVNISHINSVDENLFQQCKNLKSIIIESTKIGEIPEKLFKNQPYLNVISLQYNTFTTLLENLFLNQRNLEYLYLVGNQISCLPPNIFKPLINLWELDLSINKIQYLNPKWFENLHSLRELNLYNNKIKDLPKNIFARLEKLKWLELANNQLTTIQSDSFGIHWKLKFIHLANNKINSIDEKIFDYTEVKILDVSGNVCSNEGFKNIFKSELKVKPSKCISNYEPREELAKSIDLGYSLCIKNECGKRYLVRKLMFGGTGTTHGEFPWNVALIHKSNGLFCGGTLISKQHVVTAAHCVKGKGNAYELNSNDFTVLLGVHDHSNRNEHERVSVNVNSIVVHPDWNTDMDNYDADIAFLELTTVVEFTSQIQPICLANRNSEVARALKGTVVGFGKTESGTISNIANKLEVPIRNFHSCARHSEDHKYHISSNTFCGGPADGRGVCDGDSGGGVYVQDNGQFYLRGLVSASLVNDVMECDVKKEAIFTDVTRYYEWIIETYRIKSSNAPPIN